MTTGEILNNKLQTVLSGQPWYGRPLTDILNDVTFEAAFERAPGGIHTIAEILLHIISWQEEIIDRLNEQPAGTPTSGDWPETGDPSEEKWTRWKDDLKLVNVNLSGIILNFPQDKWNQPIIDTRETEPIVTYAELIDGAIQHLVYHSAQIALLTKLLKG
ncbi:DinB family protein [Mucilaginibacter ginkgonis]|uniref:DinB family protein n=1 Tax=Mucilaginibacter ginkgonis TaxID=2682091 RepID=A0A6I4I3L3_9SPHI|nr:DinB family protein [Mucilaginibacter ginkgonis]QQL48568.1 DinB family protein [Mucilaginibacter ginkgonis]